MKSLDTNVLLYALNLDCAYEPKLMSLIAPTAHTSSTHATWRTSYRLQCSPSATLLTGIDRARVVPETGRAPSACGISASPPRAFGWLRPLALNFANGVHPGGGFLSGATAQEETLCRSSALDQTLVGDPMYEVHARRRQPDSTDWAIYSPDVPVFRTDDGTELPHPWLLSFITCAAPVAPAVGRPRAADLLQQRIGRVLAIARAYGYATLVLGAWGCGAFGNDPRRTAVDFRQALENDYGGAFSEVVFAITDWSPERRFLGPFREVFAAEGDV